ncbi:MAG: hypothetical protein M3P47_02130 [Pseudomonadota bacterium]|nr:hypothetical protein [Pseudomonadota bacterium]
MGAAITGRADGAVRDGSHAEALSMEGVDSVEQGKARQYIGTAFVIEVYLISTKQKGCREL